MVLFASDQRVANYASRITQKFTDAGIDVYLQVSGANSKPQSLMQSRRVCARCRHWHDAFHYRASPTPPPSHLLLLLQTDLAESGLGDPSAPVPQFIKPGDLSAVIAASHGDFLIVVGDKNMKNETCQARQAGKLVEKPVDERIVSLLESWAQQTGIKPGEAPGAGASSDKAAATLSEEALVERLRRLVGAPNFVDRLGRVGRETGEVLELRRGARRGGSGMGSLPALLTGSDQETVAKLTRCQMSLVRVHKELVDALGAVRELPVQPRGGTPSPSAPGAPSHLDLGLGAGLQVSAVYRPNGAGPVSATGAAVGAALTYSASGQPQAQGAIAPQPVPIALKTRLVSLVEGYLARMEEDGAAVMEAAGEGAMALWHAYLKVG